MCLQTVSCFPFPAGDKKHGIFVCGLFVNILPTVHKHELNLFASCSQTLFADSVCRGVLALSPYKFSVKCLTGFHLCMNVSGIRMVICC
jgi:hypothetical protein